MYRKIKLTRIQDIDHLLHVIDQCRHPVFMDNGSGIICDLKSNLEIREVLKSFASQGELRSITLHADKEDSSSFLFYMMIA